jgi:hypothetical protein
MKKPVLSIDEPAPERPLRADRPPTGGFVTIADKPPLVFDSMFQRRRHCQILI